MDDEQPTCPACDWLLPTVCYATTEEQPILVKHAIVMQCPVCGEFSATTIDFAGGGSPESSESMSPSE